MNKGILLIVSLAVAISACGKQGDDAQTGAEKKGMLEQAGDMVGSAADTAKEAASQAADATQEAAGDAMDAASDMGEAAMDSTGEAMDAAKDMGAAAMDSAGDAAASAGDMAGDVADQAAEMTDAAVESAAEGVEAAKESAAAAAAPVVAAVTGGESAAAPAATAPATVASVDHSAGEAVYKKSCAACHASGAAGAPKLTDAAVWTDRLAQGEATLIKHAIEGFKGTKGYMPPKGGFASLSDDEVSAAVRYMMSQAQ